MLLQFTQLLPTRPRRRRAKNPRRRDAARRWHSRATFERVASERERALDNDLLAERRRNEVKSAAERWEDALVELLADRAEPEVLADQRDPAAEDDPPGGEERHRLSEPVGHR